MTRIAILRPEPGASATLARATALGFDAFVLPLFVTEPVAWQVPEGEFDGLVLTSANAVRLAGDALNRLSHLPVYAVGEATAAEARVQGLAVRAAGSSGVADLLGRLDPNLKLLHLAGEDRIVADVAGGPNVTEVTVYRSRPLDPVGGVGELEGTVALVHSPRAARRLARLIDESGIVRSTIAIGAISSAAAEAAGAGWARIAATERPSDEALLALAAELCKMMREP